MAFQDTPSTTTEQADKKKKGALQYNPASEIVRATLVPRMLGISPATFWRLRRRPGAKFPAAIRIGESAIGYRRADILAWMASREQHADSVA